MYLGVYNADEKEVSCFFAFFFNQDVLETICPKSWIILACTETLRVPPQVHFSFSVNKVDFLHSFVAMVPDVIVWFKTIA